MWSRFFGRGSVFAGCLILLAGWRAGEVVGAAADSVPTQEHKFTTKYTYYDEEPLTDLVKTRTDAAGRVTEYFYNDERRLTKVAYADGKSVEYVYDKLGRRVAMKDWTGTTRYTYDTLSRLIRVDQSNGLWVGFDYDWQGRVKAVTTPRNATDKQQGWRVEYGYDLLGHITQVDSPVGRFTWEYDHANGTVTRRMPNGVVTTFQHRPAGLLESIRHEQGASAGRPSQSRLLAEFSYVYHLGGRVASETLSTPSGRETTKYAYDLAGRLDRVTLPGGKSIRYQYDAMGNRLQRSGPQGTTTYAYDRWDQIQRADDTTFGHDAMGNLAWSKGPGGLTRYTYGPANHLEGVDGPLGSVRYTVDGEGRLLGRQTGAQRDNYLSLPFGDANRLLAQAEGGSLARHYIYGERLLYGGRVGQSEFYLEDRLGSVRLVTDQNQSVLRRQQFTPFGEPRGNWKPNRLTPAYGGSFFDQQARLVPTSVRAYQPQLGRFMQLRQNSGGHGSLGAMPNWGQGPFDDIALSSLAVDLSPMNVEALWDHAMLTIASGFAGVFDPPTGVLETVADFAVQQQEFMAAGKGDIGLQVFKSVIPGTVMALDVFAGSLNKPFEHWAEPFSRYRSDGFSVTHMRGRREYTETNGIRNHLEKYGYDPGATDRTRTWTSYIDKKVERTISVDANGVRHVPFVINGKIVLKEVPSNVTRRELPAWCDRTEFALRASHNWGRVRSKWNDDSNQQSERGIQRPLQANSADPPDGASGAASSQLRTGSSPGLPGNTTARTSKTQHGVAAHPMAGGRQPGTEPSPQQVGSTTGTPNIAQHGTDAQTGPGAPPLTGAPGGTAGNPGMTQPNNGVQPETSIRQSGVSPGRPDNASGFPSGSSSAMGAKSGAGAAQTNTELSPGGPVITPTAPGETQLGSASQPGSGASPVDTGSKPAQSDQQIDRKDATGAKSEGPSVARQDSRLLIGFVEPMDEAGICKRLGVSPDQLVVTEDGDVWLGKRVDKIDVDGDGRKVVRTWYTLGKKEWQENGQQRAALVYDGRNPQGETVDEKADDIIGQLKVTKKGDLNGVKVVVTGDPNDPVTKEAIRKAEEEEGATVFFVDTRGLSADAGRKVNAEVQELLESYYKKKGEQVEIAAFDRTRLGDEKRDDGGGKFDELKSNDNPFSLEVKRKGKYVIFTISFNNIPAWEFVFDEDGNLIWSGPPGSWPGHDRNVYKSSTITKGDDDGPPPPPDLPVLVEDDGPPHRRKRRRDEYWLPPPPPPPPSPAVVWWPENPAGYLPGPDDLSRNPLASPSTRRQWPPPRRIGEAVPVNRVVADSPASPNWPPRPNGGGAMTPTATRVGGVRLDRAATVVGDIGEVRTLFFDPQSGCLLLVGEKGKTELPAMRLDDLAVVIHSIYVEGVDPYLSIDPKKGDLYGPKMDVRYSDGLLFSHAGQVMCLGDYRLKVYAAGGRAGKKLTSKVEGYRSLAKIEEDLRKERGEGFTRDRRIWFRFWLVPNDIELAPSADGKSLVFEPASVRVETENMILKDGRLIPVKDQKDPVAEEFARHFTENYDKFAAEYSAYEELRRLAQIVGLVKWMYEHGVEVDLSWVDRHRTASETTPLEVDSVHWESAERNASGKLSGERVHRYFGGVTMSMNVGRRDGQKATEGSRPALTPEQVKRLRTLMQTVRETPKRETLLPNGATGVVVPGVPRRMIGAYRTVATDLTVESGVARLSLARHYNSLFTEPTAFGRGWTMLLPRLYRRQPMKGETAVRRRQPDGREKALPVYVLTDDFGFSERVFRPDPTSPGYLARYVCDSKSGVRQFLPPSSGKAARVVFHDGRAWEFDEQGYLLADVSRGSTVRYQYDTLRGGRRLLRQISRETTGSSRLWIALQYDTQGRIAEAIGSDGSKVTYTYDKNDLSSAAGPHGTLAYAYDANRLLARVIRDGKSVEHITYDKLGRLDVIYGPGDRKLVDYDIRRQSDGQLIVEESQQEQRLTYNSQRQLTAVERRGKRTEYDYHENGSLKMAVQRNVAGGENRVSYSEQGDQVTWQTPSGASLGFTLDPAGSVRDMSVNGTRVGQFRRNPATRAIEEAVFPTFRYRRVVAGDRVVREIISPTRGSAGDRWPIDLRYSTDGKLTRAHGPGGLQIDVKYEGDRIRSIATPRQTIRIDEQGNTRTVASSDGRKAMVRRNAQGDIGAIVETVGEASREQRFVGGRLAEVRNYDQGVTRYHWDEQSGLLTGVTDAMQSSIRYGYREVNGEYRLATVELPNQRTIAFATDTRGRVTEVRE